MIVKILNFLLFRALSSTRVLVHKLFIYLKIVIVNLMLNILLNFKFKLIQFIFLGAKKKIQYHFDVEKGILREMLLFGDCVA